MMWLLQNYIQPHLSSITNEEGIASDNLVFTSEKDKKDCAQCEKYITEILNDDDLSGMEKQEAILSILTSILLPKVKQMQSLQSMGEAIFEDYKRNPVQFFFVNNNYATNMISFDGSDRFLNGSTPIPFIPSEIGSFNRSATIKSDRPVLQSETTLAAPPISNPSSRLNLLAKEFIPKGISKEANDDPQTFDLTLDNYKSLYSPDAFKSLYPQDALITHSYENEIEEVDNGYADRFDSEFTESPGDADDSQDFSLTPQALLSKLFPMFNQEQIMEILENAHYEMEVAIDISLHLHQYPSTKESVLLKATVAYLPTETSTQVETSPDRMNHIKVVPSETFLSSNPTLPAYSEAAPLGSSFFQTTKRPVCRHFLAGVCYRKDCTFSHNLEAKLCKFWLQGSCILGSECAFSHGDTLLSTKSATMESQQNSMLHKRMDELLEDEEETFPDLMASLSMSSKGNSSLESRNGKSKKKKTFSLSAMGPSLSGKPTKKFSDAIKAPIIKATQEDEKLQYLISNRKNETPGKSSFMDKSSFIQKQSHTDMANAPKSAEMAWVETGETLGHQYEASRFQAKELALQRNRLFQRATEAYLAGKYSLSKSLSLEATYINKQMHQMHASAAHEIFNARNTMSSHKDQTTIDLHGLHQKEALAILQQKLKSLSAVKFNGMIRVITGTGHHSKDGKAKILPAVEGFLRQEKYRYSHTSMSDGRGGVLQIHF